jgi:hypothetical protein
VGQAGCGVSVVPVLSIEALSTTQAAGWQWWSPLPCKFLFPSAGRVPLPQVPASMKLAWPPLVKSCADPQDRLRLEDLTTQQPRDVRAPPPSPCLACQHARRPPAGSSPPADAAAGHLRGGSFVCGPGPSRCTRALGELSCRAVPKRQTGRVRAAPQRQRQVSEAAPLPQPPWWVWPLCQLAQLVAGGRSVTVCTYTPVLVAAD